MRKNRFLISVVALAVCQLVHATDTSASVDPVGAVPQSAPAVQAGGAPAQSVPEASSAPPAPDAAKGDKSPAPVLEPIVPLNTGASTKQAVPPDEPAPSAGNGVKPEAKVAQEPRISRGNDRVVAIPPQPAPVEGASTSLNFEEVPIVEVVNMMMKDIIKADYVIHQPVAGTLTLSTRGEVSADTAVALLESGLQANGLQMVRDPRGVYHVGRPETLRGIVPAMRMVLGSKPLPPGYGAIVVPLQYIGAAEMASILKPMMPGEGLVRVDTVRNLLVLVGSRSQAEGWLDIVNTFDVDLLKGMSVGLYPLKYATVKEVEAALNLVSGKPASSGGAAGGVAAAAGAQGAAPAAAGNAASLGSGAALTEGFPLFGALRIMPLERLNSILVVTPRAAYLEQAKAWIDKFDKPGGGSGEPQLFVYPVQNGSAKHLAQVIGGLFGTGQQTGSNGTGVAPGLNTSTGQTSSNFLGSSTTGSSLFGSTTSSGITSGTTGSGLASSVGSLNRSGSSRNGNEVLASYALGSSVRLIADQANNAILIWGTRAEYEKVEATLKRLDVPPTQVLIDASIIEVTLTGDLQYGLQWAFNKTYGNGSTGAGVLSNSTSGGIATAAQGFTYTLKNSAGNIQAVLNALATDSLVKVISSPSLMVLDNNTATISVGTQQPVQSSSTVITGGAVSNSITYVNTGVNLMVTPSVNAGNMVTLDLTQNVTDVGAVDSATGQRAFLQRQIDSKVAVRSGENLVLGGLIQDNSTTGSSGLPLLSSLPIVGGLFGTKTANKARTELLVVLTPRVVRSDQELRDVSEEVRDRMKGLAPDSFTVK